MLGAIFLGVSGSNVWAITQTLAGPSAAGRWTGFQNAVGNLSGAVAPALAGFILQRTGHFGGAFAIATVVALLGAASWFFVVGRIEPVMWHQHLKRAAAVS
jgi:MFS transporter, ACS family, D-galactonate transporter